MTIENLVSQDLWDLLLYDVNHTCF